MDTIEINDEMKSDSNIIRRIINRTKPASIPPPEYDILAVVAIISFMVIL